MGGSCSRRYNRNHVADFESEWELVFDQAPTELAAESIQSSALTMTAATLRFQKAAKKIIMLLTLRRVWSSMGSWLNTRQSYSSNKRTIISSLWKEISKSHIRRYAHIFSHLERRRGVLTYK